MNVKCQLYDPQTGEIKGTYDIPEDTYQYMKEHGEYLVLGECDIYRSYISGGQIVERPRMELQQDKREIASDGEDTVTLSGLPVPCTVRIGREEYEVSDGVFEWSTFLEGSYAVRVIAFPYIDFESEVVALESGTQTD